MLLIMALIFLGFAGDSPLGWIGCLFCLGLWVGIKAIKDEENW